MQQPVVFHVRGEKLFGMLHTPDDADGAAAGVVLCHGFTGSKVEAHFLFVKMARALESAGIAALRFDFRGSGDSEGEFEDVTVSAEIEDAAQALEVLASESAVDAGRLGVLGLSLGGCVAACLAGRDPRVRSLALWSAVARPEAICSEPPRKAWGDFIQREGRIDIGGLLIGREFMDDLANHDPVAAVRRSDAAVLVVHGGADASVPITDAELFHQAAAARNAPAKKHIIPDASHTFAHLKWEREVIAVTTEWFKETLLTMVNDD